MRRPLFQPRCSSRARTSSAIDGSGAPRRAAVAGLLTVYPSCPEAGNLSDIGALTAYGAIRMRVKTAQAHTRPTVPGTILSSELETDIGYHDGKRIQTYGAAIRYAYGVGGKTYESEQTQLGGWSETSWPEEFAQIVARYPKGKRVTVYYDTDHPSTATLEPGALGGIFNMAMVAGGAVLVGAILIGLSLWGDKLVGK